MALSLFNSITMVLLLASLWQPSHGSGMAQDGSNTRRLFVGSSRLTVAPTCGELALESQCTQNTKCSWCKSHDLDDMCFAKSEALRLPHQVFSCAFIRS